MDSHRLIEEMFIPLLRFCHTIQLLLTIWDIFPFDLLVVLFDQCFGNPLLHNEGLIHSVVQELLDIAAWLFSRLL